METSADELGKSVDWISKLPNDLLLMILSRLSTEESIRTSVVSKRWEHVWKQMSHLVLDMQRFINSKEMLYDSNRTATLMTKVINYHSGHLESCVIHHYADQCQNGMLNTWIQSLKHTKHLTLKVIDSGKFLDFEPNSFGYPSLTSLSLDGYRLKTSHSFNNNCQNLKTLKLSCIFKLEVGVFNRILASCPSLEVLVLYLSSFNKGPGEGPLMIDNTKLRFLQLSCCTEIDRIIVSSTCLDILSIDEILSCRKDDIVIASPRLHFHRNWWLTRTYPHISYNISQEKKSVGYEEAVVKTIGDLLRFSVSGSLSNNNAPREEENESSLWEVNNIYPFPNAKFRVETVWMHNFSGSSEEFALTSYLIRQGAVVKRMMIKTASFSAEKKLEIESAVAKLHALRTKDQRNLTIECF